MDKKLFVGGLPFSLTDQALASLFAQSGTVTSAQIIIDKYTQNSRGFAFVEMSSEEEAKEAIKKLNNSQVGGRKITVSIAKAREERSDYKDNNHFKKSPYTGNGRQNRY